MCFRLPGSVAASLLWDIVLLHKHKQWLFILQNSGLFPKGRHPGQQPSPERSRGNLLGEKTSLVISHLEGSLIMKCVKLHFKCEGSLGVFSETL